MEITPPEALDLLRSVAERAADARRAWDEARDVRDELVRIFDGQEGMARTEMAHACGITRKALWDIVQAGRPESVEDNALMSDDLRHALEAALGGALGGGEVRLDVHA